MAFSLRLPPALDAEARQRAEQIGIPLNGLICFALDLYLRGGSSAGRPAVVVDDLDFVNPRRVSRAGMPLKHVQAPTEVRQPGKLFSEAEALAIVKKASTPVLEPLQAPLPGASKAERRAFTENQRMLRKQGQK